MGMGVRRNGKFKKYTEHEEVQESVQTGNKY